MKGAETKFDSFIAGEKIPHTGDLYKMVYPAGNETEQDTAYDLHISMMKIPLGG